MPTNALGSGTCNLSVNVPKAFRSIIGKAAFKRIQSGEYRSAGEFIRHLILRGMELTDIDAALQLRAVRNGALSFALLSLVCWSTWESWIHADDSNMRARRGRSVARVSIRNRTSTGESPLIPVLDGLEDNEHEHGPHAHEEREELEAA